MMTYTYKFTKKMTEKQAFFTCVEASRPCNVPWLKLTRAWDVGGELEGVFLALLEQDDMKGQIVPNLIEKSVQGIGD